VYRRAARSSLCIRASAATPLHPALSLTSLPPARAHAPRPRAPPPRVRGRERAARRGRRRRARPRGRDGAAGRAPLPGPRARAAGRQPGAALGSPRGPDRPRSHAATVELTRRSCLPLVAPLTAAGGYVSREPSMSGLRIIGGTFKGRRLVAPPGLETRPLPDRVKQSLFDWLGQRLDGLHVVDCCAGSGAFAFEALSRGATRVAAIEPGRRAAPILRANAAKRGH